MAQHTKVLLIDDLDGSEAEETVAFGLDGGTYEIDLSSDNATQLREALAAYVAHGRRAAGARSASSAGGRRRSAGSRPASNTSDVRSWARSHGYSVNDRGRVASEVLAAYEAAH